MKRKVKIPVYKYAGTTRFDPNASVHLIDMFALEKRKLSEATLPSIKKLEKEASKNKKETEKSRKEMFDYLFKIKTNQWDLRIEYEDRKIYPRPVDPPDIRYIQIPEPSEIVADIGDDYQEWHNMPELIKDFAEESYVCYYLGLWLSSMASAINCCEYILKYEYLRDINTTDKKKAYTLSVDRGFSLGRFIAEDKYLDQLKIKTKFKDKIQYLNDVRVSIYHSNPERTSKVNAKGILEVEKHSSVTDSMHRPILAFRIYSIMMELINQFYSLHKSAEYLNEGVNAWLKKHNMTLEGLKNEK